MGLLLVARPRLGRLRRRAAGFPPLLARFFFSRVPLRFVRSAFGLLAFLRAGGQHRFRLRPMGQARLATGDGIGEDQPVGQGPLVRLRAERIQLTSQRRLLSDRLLGLLGLPGNEVIFPRLSSRWRYPSFALHRLKDLAHPGG